MIAVSDVCPYFINPRSPISKSIGIAGSKLEGKSSVSGVEAEYFHFKYSLFPAHFSQVFIIPCLF